MQAVANAVDADGPAAYIEIYTASYAQVIVTITLASDPSFTVAGNPAAMTMNGAPKSGTAALAGTNVATVARIKSGSGSTIVDGLTVGVGSGDVQLNSTSISQSQTVTLTSAVITHAADV